MGCLMALYWAPLVLGLITAGSGMLVEDLVDENGVRTSVFLSPKFVMGPGSVVQKDYFNVDFPKGHIALKSLDAEVVDEAGNPISLHETYIHHWVVVRYQQRKGTEIPGHIADWWLYPSEVLVMGNSGVCQDSFGHDNLGQYFGLGSETRKTFTHIPDPYGIEVGNPADIVRGFEGRWMLAVHAIDTRDVEDRLECAECRCDLYNVTKEQLGQLLDQNYKGGAYCCLDHQQCRLKADRAETETPAPARGLYMKYTVRWVIWSPSVVPVRIYIFDVTDTWNKESHPKHHCTIEFNVEPCNGGEDCTLVRRAASPIPKGGHVVYGVSHQHSGGNGSTLYGVDGRVICTSTPTYGTGTEPGNEAGYIVGMSTCYPTPGSVTLSDGEILTLESNYTGTRSHTGVMGLFYILVADHAQGLAKMSIVTPFTSAEWVPMVGVFGMAIIVAAGIAFHHRKLGTEDGYEAIVMYG